MTQDATKRSDTAKEMTKKLVTLDRRWRNLITGGTDQRVLWRVDRWAETGNRLWECGRRSLSPRHRPSAFHGRRVESPHLPEDGAQRGLGHPQVPKQHWGSVRDLQESSGASQSLAQPHLLSGVEDLTSIPPDAAPAEWQGACPWQSGVSPLEGLSALYNCLLSSLLQVTVSDVDPSVPPGKPCFFSIF